MKSTLAVVALTGVALLYGGDTYAQSRSYLRTPPSPELYNWYSLMSPSPGTVFTITVSSRNAPLTAVDNTVTISGVDSNGNVSVTFSDGTSVSVPANTMDDRSIGDLIDVANQVANLGGFDNTMVSESDYSSADADFSGSGDQNSDGAEYE